MKVWCFSMIFRDFISGVICRGTILIYQVLYIIGILILARGLCITVLYIIIWVFPKIGVPQNGWFIMDDLGYPYFRKHPYIMG